MSSIVITSIAFAAFAFVGFLVARTYYGGVQAIADGPKPSEPPVTMLLVAAAILGGVCAYRGLPAQSLAMIAASIAIMTAIWYTDVTRGIVPDTLTLIPLGALVVAGLLTGRWYVAVAAAIPAVPFAIMAWRTGGLGMGWGDVKLAALGGALLGMQTAMLAFALASLLAIVIARVRRAEREPLAFGPYLASAIILPLCLHT